MPTDCKLASDQAYEGMPGPSLTVAITDDDVAAVLLEQSDNATEVSEGGSSDSYDVSLAKQPQQTVVIRIASGDQLVATPIELTFTPDNYSVPQDVAVTAVDDTLVEGAHLGTLVHWIETTDAGYSVVTVDDLVVSITDNDVAPSPGRSGGGSLDGLFLMAMLLGLLAGLCRGARRLNLAFSIRGRPAPLGLRRRGPPPRTIPAASAAGRPPGTRARGAGRVRRTPPR